MAGAAGADAVSVSAYANTSTGWPSPRPLVQQKAGFLPWAAEIKAAVKIPVIAVGRLEPGGRHRHRRRPVRLRGDGPQAAGRPGAAAQARREPAGGHPARASTATPASARSSSTSASNARVNPLTGHEFETRLNPVDTPAHVVVVGGGPAGLEAAGSPRSAAIA